MIEQRSDEWFALRLGKVTASRINDVLSTLKSGGEAASRKNYRTQLVVERLTNTKADSFTNAAMEWGTAQEPFARQAYQFLTDYDVDEVAFVDHPGIAMSGCSPDGLIGKDGMVEIKCPNTATHIEWLLAGVVPAEHHNQMLWQMDCASREWCDFVSYDPRLPLPLQFFKVRFMFDEKRVETMRASVVNFLGEVSETVAKLKLRMG